MTQPFIFHGPEINPRIFDLVVTEVIPTDPHHTFSAIRTLRAMRSATLDQLDGIVFTRLLPKPEAVDTTDAHTENILHAANTNRRVYHATIQAKDNQTSVVNRNTLVGVGVFEHGKEKFNVSGLYVPASTDDFGVHIGRRGVASALLTTALHEAPDESAVTQLTLPAAHARTEAATHELQKWGFNIESGVERIDQREGYELPVIDFDGLTIEALRNRLETRHSFLRIAAQPVLC